MIGGVSSCKDPIPAYVPSDRARLKCHPSNCRDRRPALPNANRWLAVPSGRRVGSGYGARRNAQRLAKVGVIVL